MKWNILTSMSFLFILFAAVYGFQRAQEPGYIGIDFVQFHLTGRHVVNGGDSHVYSDKTRREILERVCNDATSEGTESKFYHAVNFRHVRTWETYSSPFLYAVFGATAGQSSERNRESRERYEIALRRFWIVCLVATMIGFITFGWVLRIPAWSMLFGAACLAWFSPLRIDMNVANVNQIQFGMVGVLAAILSGRWKLTDRAGVGCESGHANRGAHHAERDEYIGGHFIAGVWLGLCLAFKPSLLWCGVMWLGPMIWVAIQSREFRACFSKLLIAAIVGGVLGATIAVAFSAIWFPLHCWIEWIQVVGSLPDEIIQTEQGNYSLTYFARSHGIPAWSLAMVGPVLGRGLSFIEGRRLFSRAIETSLETRSTEIAECQAIGCLIHMLTSNLVWYHYGMLSLPAMIVMLRRVVTSTSRAEATLLGGILLWCLLLIGLQPTDEIITSPPNEHFLRCTIANVLLLILVVITTRDRLISNVSR